MKVGRHQLLAVQDGMFVMPPHFLGDSRAHQELADPDGIARLPISAFLVPGDEPLLIDAGLGPDMTGDVMIGGYLLSELQLHGLRAEDIRHIALSHLHADHAGWLATQRDGITFPNAQIYLGADDWQHFIDGERRGPSEATRSSLLELAERGQVTLLDRETQIVSGVTAMPAPGHTPGHMVHVVHDGDERALLFGDAVYCPQQLTEVDWAATSEVDPVLARRTREWLWREVEETRAVALGQHFPGLRAGRVLSSTWQPALS